jgi:hypothetical protein
VRESADVGVIGGDDVWDMMDDLTTIMSACGRLVGPEEIRQAQELVQMCSGLSRSELAFTLCEHWGWVGATGKLQRRACEKVLERLEAQGLVKLPAKQGNGRGCKRQSAAPGAAIEEATSPGSLIESTLAAIRPVQLERVEGREETGLWNAFVERYHFLGYKRPFGCSLRYFITSSRARLGCLLVASGARALRDRDEWIGWTAQQRLSNLPYVINNSRFLLFPWVRVAHLASHVLGQLARQIRADWQARWNYQPALLETFVDSARHRGVCYRAAGWVVIGETTGKGLKVRGHRYRTSKKRILVRPLVDDFRERLLSEPQTRSLKP